MRCRPWNSYIQNWKTRGSIEHRRNYVVSYCTRKLELKSQTLTSELMLLHFRILPKFSLCVFFQTPSSGDLGDTSLCKPSGTISAKYRKPIASDKVRLQVLNNLLRQCVQSFGQTVFSRVFIAFLIRACYEDSNFRMQIFPFLQCFLAATCISHVLICQIFLQ